MEHLRIRGYRRIAIAPMMLLGLLSVNLHCLERSQVATVLERGNRILVAAELSKIETPADAIAVLGNQGAYRVR